MKTKLIFCLTASLLGWSAPTSADVLELKNGELLEGKYVGGTAGSIRFETANGLQVIEITRAMALTFTTGTPTTPPPAPAPTPAPAAAAPTAVSISAGTTILVRMVDGASSRDAKGKRFTAVLESDLTAGGATVIKAGSKVYGRVEAAQEARRVVGQSKLDLRLSELAVGATLVPIVTGPYAQAGARSIGTAAKGAAAGAAIGAIADGSDGAATGAAIGAVAGGLKKGQTITIPPGTLLEFQLKQPVNLNVVP